MSKFDNLMSKTGVLAGIGTVLSGVATVFGDTVGKAFVNNSELAQRVMGMDLQSSLQTNPVVTAAGLTAVGAGLLATKVFGDDLVQGQAAMQARPRILAR